eukprot:8468548-Lingulodinium_polyedra.AAC.1
MPPWLVGVEHRKSLRAPPLLRHAATIAAHFPRADLRAWSYAAEPPAEPPAKSPAEYAESEREETDNLG